MGPTNFSTRYPLPHPFEKYPPAALFRYPRQSPPILLDFPWQTFAASTRRSTAYRLGIVITRYAPPDLAGLFRLDVLVKRTQH